MSEEQLLQAFEKIPRLSKLQVNGPADEEDEAPPRKKQKKVHTGSLYEETEQGEDVKHLKDIPKMRKHPILRLGYDGYLGGIAANRAGRERGDLPNEVRTYAHFAKAAYERTARMKKRIVGLLGPDWTLEGSISARNRTVFVNHATKEVVTAIRGTDLKDLSDLGTDLALAVGAEFLSPRFKAEQKAYGLILDRYGEGWTHTLASHSLGASINTYLKGVYGDRISAVHNYNPGASITAAKQGLQELFFGKRQRGVHNYHVVGDPISAITQSGETSEVFEMRRGTLNSHSIDQFLD